MKYVIVVGGSSGIGLALCQILTAKGVSVTNISRTPCAVADVKNILCDVRDYTALAKSFRSVAQADALVYCAGVSMAAPVEYADRAVVRDLFDVNTLGAIDCCKLAMQKLNASGNGRIVLLSSSAGVAPIPFDSFYTASKAALIGFSRALNLETDGKVKCTAALIGGTQTRFSFKRKVLDDCGEYSKNLKTATDALIKVEQTGYSAQFVASRIAKILDANTPPPVVTIGIKNKLQLFIYRHLPQKLGAAAIRFMYGLGRSEK